MSVQSSGETVKLHVGTSAEGNARQATVNCQVTERYLGQKCTREIYVELSIIHLNINVYFICGYQLELLPDLSTNVTVK